MRKLILIIPVVLGLLLCSRAFAETTAIRTQQALKAISDDDVALFERLMNTPELSINQNYAPNLNWTNATINECSPKIMSYLLKMNAPRAVPPGSRIALLQYIDDHDPIRSSKCLATAEVALSDMSDFDLMDYMRGCGSSKSIRFMIMHGAQSTKINNAGRNFLQQSVMSYNLMQCIDDFRALFTAIHHPEGLYDASEGLDPPVQRAAFDGPLDWIMNQVNDWNSRGLKAIDLTQPIFYSSVKPDMISEVSSVKAEIANILLHNGSAPPKKVSKEECIAEILGNFVPPKSFLLPTCKE